MIASSAAHFSVSAIATVKDAYVIRIDVEDRFDFAKLSKAPATEIILRTLSNGRLVSGRS